MKILKGKYAWFAEGDIRMDASFHLSEGRVARKTMEKSPLGNNRLGNISHDIFYGGRAKRIYVDNEVVGIPFMGSSDMLKSDLNSLKFISKKLTKNLDGYMLKEGWVLISRSGTIGNTAYVNKDFLDKAASEHIIRIVPKEHIKSGYLYSFLTSKFGLALMTQGTFGAVIQHIEPDYLAELPIPILPDGLQQEIHTLIVEASNLRAEANKLFTDAIAKIEEQFNFKKPKKIFTVNLRRIKSGDKYTNENRLESDFYQPATRDLETQIKKTGSFGLLGDLSESVTISNLRGRTFVKQGIVLFTGQSLGLLKPDMSKQMSRTLTKNIESNTTKDGDVLITAFGTLGKVEFCYQNFYSGVFASQQIARIRVNDKKIDAGYIYLFLKSKVGQAMVLKYKTGSVIEWANWNNFCSILIPIPKDKGKSYGNVARTIAKKFDAAYQKEKKAIDLIEKEIESWQK